MNRVYITLVFIAFSILLATNASPQVKRGPEIGVYGGALLAADGATQLIDGIGEIRTAIRDGGIGGVRIGYNFHPRFGLDMSVGGSTNDHMVELWALGEQLSTEETTELFFLHGNGIFHLLKGRFVPFITAGLGWTAFVDDASFTANYGGGLKLFITERITLRFDVRELHTELEGTIGVVTVGRNLVLIEEEIPFSDELRFTEITLGLSVLF